MPKAKSKSKKTRVASKGTNGLRPHFKIWVGALIVLIIAVVGFVVVRFGEASFRPAWRAWVRDYDEKRAPWEVVDNVVIRKDKSGDTYHFWYAGDRARDGAKVWWSVGSGKCVTITPEGSFKKGVYDDHNYYNGEWVTIWEQNPDECRLRTPNRT